MVKFGEVVKNANLVEREPEANGIERIVGLEHIDPENLHIRRWNSVADGTSFTRKFVPGQTLFGKRRAYQRKVAYAEFEGICSGDILTFEPKDEKVLLHELLPFICQSEAFFDHALGTSAGSLSPRTSWKALKDFEFPLPPLDEQKRIAEILWAADEAMESAATSLDQSIFFEKRLLLHLFENSETWPSKRIGNAGDVQLGRQRSPKYTTGKYTKPYLRVVNVLDGRLDFSDVEEMDFDVRDFERYRLKNGDILITEGDITSPYNVGRNAVYRDEIENCCFQNTLIRLRCFDGLIPEYASACLRYMFYKGVFAGVANTTTVTHLGGTRFASMRIPIPDPEKQRAIVKQVHSARENMTRAEDHVARSKELLTTLRQTLIFSMETANV